MQEPNLEELKEQVLNGSEFVEKIEPAKVKLFKVIGYKTFDALKNVYNEYDGKAEIERQINEFLSTFDGWYLESADVKVVKNFYPHTQNAEYEEIWYGIVVYRDEK